jgi:hypothetical protein
MTIRISDVNTGFTYRMLQGHTALETGVGVP